MPSLGRLDHFGALPLAESAMLLPSQFGPSNRIVQSLLWGVEFTATVDNTKARVRLDLFWPDVRTATITRLDADGTTSLVRNADPVQLCTRAVLYDHEAPLDTTFTYRVTPSDDTSVYWDTDPVTLVSNGLVWLKHPFKPALNRTVHVYALPDRALGARRGIARPIDRADPIVVYQTRTTDTGSLVLQSDGTWAENTALRALFADGAPLLLQQPSTLGEGQLYIAVDTLGLRLLDEQAAWMYQRNWTVPFDVITRPAGRAAGAAGATFADAAAAYPTFAHLAAGEPTFTDLATQPGP